MIQDIILLPTADGAEDPESEFLLECSLHCDFRKHRNKMIINKITKPPPSPPTMAANEVPMQ